MNEPKLKSPDLINDVLRYAQRELPFNTFRRLIEHLNLLPEEERKHLGGHCAYQTIALVALLKSQGIRAWPISDGNDFHYAVACMYEGEFYYLDLFLFQDEAFPLSRFFKSGSKKLKYGKSFLGTDLEYSRTGDRAFAVGMNYPNGRHEDIFRFDLNALNLPSIKTPPFYKREYFMIMGMDNQEVLKLTLNVKTGILKIITSAGAFQECVDDEFECNFDRVASLVRVDREKLFPVLNQVLEAYHAHWYEVKGVRTYD